VSNILAIQRNSAPLQDLASVVARERGELLLLIDQNDSDHY